MSRVVTRLAVMLAVVAFAGLADCESPYTVQVQADCVVHNTAKLNATNASVKNSSYDVLWDGVKIATVAPGQTSGDVTEGALVLHVLQFNVAGTTTVACAPQLVTLSQCATTNFNCKV